jgi:outer membrane protein
MKSLPLILASGVLLAASSLPAHAANGDRPGFYGAIGYSSLQPKSGNGTLAGAFRTDIGNDSEPTLTLGYRFTGNWSAELWLPVSKFKHTVKLDGMTSASIKHMPYLLTAQYHFMAGSRFQPFVGLGYGWVNVNGERTEGPIAGTSLDVKKGDGVTAQIGADMFASDNVFVRADVRYFDWKSNVSLNGAGIGQVKVNPYIYSLSVGYQF